MSRRLIVVTSFVSPFYSEQGSGFITHKGRTITNKVKEMLEGLGFHIAQVDTDGMWVFVPDNFPLLVKCNSGNGSIEILKELINCFCDE